MSSSLGSAIFLVVTSRRLYASDFSCCAANWLLACNVNETSKCLWFLGFGIQIPTSLVLFSYRSLFLMWGIMKSFHVEIKLSETMDNFFHCCSCLWKPPLSAVILEGSSEECDCRFVLKT